MKHTFARPQFNYLSRFALSSIIVILILGSTILISSVAPQLPVPTIGIDPVLGAELVMPTPSCMDKLAGSFADPEQETWAQMSPLEVEQWLGGVWGSSGSDVYAVGVSGTVVHYDGDSWESLNIGTTKHFQSVWGYSSQDIFVVGWDSSIFYYDGSTWSSMENSVTSQLCDVRGYTDSPVVIPSHSMQGQSLNVTIAASWEYRVFAVGDHGYILYYVDHMNSDFTGATAVDFGQGITVDSFTVDSNYQITVSITVDNDALTGIRDVSVVTPRGTNTLFGAFIVDLDNQAPVVYGQTVAIDEDTVMGITLAGSDVDGDPLSYNVVNAPEHGTLTGIRANLAYTPDENYNGPDSFTFKANDGEADSNIATVTLNVDPVNDAPLADDQTIITDEDTAVGIILTGSDVDGDPLSYRVVNAPEHGTLTGTGVNLSYTLNQKYYGMDSFTFELSDGISSDVAIVTIDVSEASSQTLPDNETYSITTPERNITIEFPAGSVSSEIDVVIAKNTLPDVSTAPAGFGFGNTCFAVEFDGELMADATVIIKYSHEDVIAAGGDPHLLALARYNESVDEWIVLTTAVDASAGTLTTTTDGFSIWAVLARDSFQGFTTSSSRSMSSWIWFTWISIIVAVVGVFALIYLLRRRTHKRSSEL